MDIKYILHEFSSKIKLVNGIHSLLKRNDARGNAYIMCTV